MSLQCQINLEWSLWPALFSENGSSSQWREMRTNVCCNYMNRFWRPRCRIYKFWSRKTEGKTVQRNFNWLRELSDLLETKPEPGALHIVVVWWMCSPRMNVAFQWRLPFKNLKPLMINNKQHLRCSNHLHCDCRFCHDQVEYTIEIVGPQRKWVLKSEKYRGTMFQEYLNVKQGHWGKYHMEQYAITLEIPEWQMVIYTNLCLWCSGIFQILMENQISIALFQPSCSLNHIRG